MRKKKTRKTVLDKVIPYQSLTGCAFSLRSKRGRKFWARPVKPLADRQIKDARVMSEIVPTAANIIFPRENLLFCIVATLSKTKLQSSPWLT